MPNNKRTFSILRVSGYNEYNGNYFISDFHNTGLCFHKSINNFIRFCNKAIGDISFKTTREAISSLKRFSKIKLIRKDIQSLGFQPIYMFEEI